LISAAGVVVDEKGAGFERMTGARVLSLAEYGMPYEMGFGGLISRAGLMFYVLAAREPFYYLLKQDPSDWRW
jgi:hypothetical protein